MTFDEAANIMKASKTSIDTLNWMRSVCTCPQFFKRGVCKHIIGISIRLGLTQAPLEAKSVPLGQKRKRGRPSKAKPALVRQ